MIYCFKCIFEGDLAVPAPGDEGRFHYPRPGERNPDRVALPAVTVVNGEAKCRQHFSEDHKEPVRIIEAR